MQQQVKRTGGGGGGATRTNAVAAGSVWETRMKMDQVRGGIKVFFNAMGEHATDPPDPTTTSSPSQDHAHATTASTNRHQTHRKKRKSWKQPELESGPIELRRALSELANASRNEEEPTSPRDPSVLDESTLLDSTGRTMEMGVEEKKGLFEDDEMDLCEEEKKIDKIRDVPISSNATTSLPQHEAPVLTTSKVAGIGKLASMEVEEGFEDSVETQRSRLQSIVDLVMWRDISRSALVFGMGAFLLISSSYAEHLEFSFISAISYLGLLYLALIFLYDSLFSREAEGFRESDERWVIGEEEAIWVIKLALPYMNEVLLKLKSLFSGDPITTMKLAVILFGLGKCCGQITMWTMGKLAFFGLFTIPRLWASQADRICRYGMFWLERMRNAWVSCNHKKVVGVVLFALFWNLSSVTSRIWAVFMLLVSLRCYHEHLLAVADWTPTGDQQEKVDVSASKWSHVSESMRTLTPPHCVSNVERAAAGGGTPLRHEVGPTGSGAVGSKQKKRA